MKAMMIIGEWLCGLVVLLLTLIVLLLGSIIGITELPRYFRIKSM
jgi:hypothetical protein